MREVVKRHFPPVVSWEEQEGQVRQPEMTEEIPQVFSIL